MEHAFKEMGWNRSLRYLVSPWPVTEPDVLPLPIDYQIIS